MMKMVLKLTAYNAPWSANNAKTQSSVLFVIQNRLEN